MKITDVKVFKVKKSKKNGNLKAFASITFDDAFVVKNLRIVEGTKGLFVSMPSQKGNDDEYYDVAFPITKKLRNEITKAVLESFEDEDEL